MNTLVVVASLCVAAFASPIFNKDLDSDWVLYKQAHKKTYNQQEEQLRYVVVVVVVVVVVLLLPLFL